MSGRAGARGAANGIHRKEDMAGKRTDRTRWRLLDERGRQRWKYLRTDKEVEEWPQSLADRNFLGLDMVSSDIKRIRELRL